MKRKAILTLMALTLSFFSCKKESSHKLRDNTTSSESFIPLTSPTKLGPSNFPLVHFSSDSLAKEYAKLKLTQLAKIFAGLTKDSTFRTLLSMSTLNSVDSTGEENCILIENLVDFCSAHSYNLVTQAENYMTEYNLSGNFTDLINSFKNVDSCNYYPQIYIPTPITTPTSGIIHTVPYWGNEYDPNYDMYSLNQSFELTVTNQIEEQISNSNVWVISINESVNNYGVIPLPNESEQTFEGEEYQAKTTSYEPYTISNIMLKTRKEKFLSGFSDLRMSRAIISGSSNSNGIIPIGRCATIDIDGDQILQTKLVNYSVPLNYLFVSNWSDYNPWMVYVIYEFDAWPVSRANFDVPLYVNPTKSVSFKCRTNDSPFIKQNFYKGDSQGGYYVWKPTSQEWYSTDIYLTCGRR